MLEFSSTESCTTGATSTPLVGFSSNDSSCDGNVALMNDFESTGGCSGQGPQGPDGFSAYQIAVFDGFVGTETQWLASLVGPGVPVGGTAGQILAKIDLTNYNTQWINLPSLTGYVPYIGATQALNLGAFSLTANSIIKNGGTSSQYLMADGSTSLGFVLPALNSGSVLFSNGTTIAQDNANFFFDDTNNRLGIGTNAPTSTLHIKAQGLLLTDIVLRLRNSTDTADLLSLNGAGGFNINSSIGAASDRPISVGGSTGDLFYVRGYGDAFIKATLFLGAIGGSNFISNGTLSIRSNQGTGTSFAAFTHNNGNIALRLFSNSNIELNPAAGNVLIATSVDNGGKLQIKAGGSASTDIALRVRNSGDTADLMNFAGNGFMGIGVATPNNLLNVGYNLANTSPLASIGFNPTSGNIASTNGYLALINIVAADPVAGISTGAMLGFNSSSSNFYGQGIGAIRNSKYDIWYQTGSTNGGGYRWYIGTSEKLTIDYLGKVGIGTTTPTASLHISGASATALLKISNPSSVDFIIKSDSTLTDYTGLYWGTDYKFLSKQSATLFINVANNIYFANGFATKTTMNSNGQLGIGVAAVGSILATLHVKGDGTNPIARFESSAGNNFFTINNLGQAIFGSVGANEPYLVNYNGTSTESGIGQSLRIRQRANTGATGNTLIQYWADGLFNNTTSGTAISHEFLSSGVACAVGNTIYRNTSFAYTINNTGAQTGRATGIFLNATETALNGMGHNLMDLQIGGASRFIVNNVGSLFTNNFAISRDVSTGADGNVVLSNSGVTNFGLLKLGGTTSSFPAIKRNGAGIDFRVADDSAACNIGALNITALGGLAAYSTIEGYSTSQAASLRGSVRVGSLGSNDASAILDVISTTKGFLPPRMTTAQKVGIATPATGLVVFDTDLGKLCVFAVTWQTITSV